VLASKMKKRLLIAGASGFIGSNFILRSEEVENYDVTATYNSSDPSTLTKGINYVKADLENYDTCLHLCESTDYILNFAGVMLTSASRKNNEVTNVLSNTSVHLNLIHAAKNMPIEKYIWLSSTTGYPVIPRAVKEIDFHEGDVPSRYFSVGHMYRFIENIANHYLSNKSTLITLRPTGVYGERDDFNPLTSHILPALVNELSTDLGRKEFFADKSETRDWIYVGDFIKAVDRILSTVENNICLNIGNGKPVSMYDLHGHILKAFASSRDFTVSERLFDDGSSINRNIDCSLSVRELGYYNETSLMSGIEKTIKWFRDNPNA